MEALRRLKTVLAPIMLRRTKVRSWNCRWKIASATEKTILLLLEQ